MRIVYLDCSTGVSGDMLISSLAHCLEELEGEGKGFRYVESELARLGLTGFRLGWSQKSVAGILTWHVDVVQTEEQPLRTYTNLVDIIAKSRIAGKARDAAIEAVTLLGRAEAKVHGVDLERVHFHEIGAVDTIVDIVGAMVLLEALGAETVICSPVDLGSGFVEIAHGKMPVPAPACAELAQCLTTFGSDCGMERATPTGLAVLRAVADGCGPLPMGRVLSVGYGSGGRSSDHQPTYVRAFALEGVDESLKSVVVSMADRTPQQG